MEQQIETHVMVATWKTEFVSWLERQGCSEKTLQAYLQDAQVFERYFFSVNGQAFEPALLTGVDLRGFREWSMQEGVETSHVEPAPGKPGQVVQLGERKQLCKLRSLSGRRALRRGRAGSSLAGGSGLPAVAACARARNPQSQNKLRQAPGDPGPGHGRFDGLCRPERS